MTRRLVLLGFTVGLLIAALSGRVLAQEEADWLIPEWVVKLPPAPTTRAAPEPPQGGPIIQVKSPPLDGEVVRPFTVEIVFEPRPGGAPVQMESLEVKALKLWEISITDKFRPHIREDRIFVKDAKFPSGRHRLKVSIADTEGNMTVQIFEVTVR